MRRMKLNYLTFFTPYSSIPKTKFMIVFINIVNLQMINFCLLSFLAFTNNQLMKAKKSV